MSMKVNTQFLLVANATELDDALQDLLSYIRSGLGADSGVSFTLDEPSAIPTSTTGMKFCLFVLFFLFVFFGGCELIFLL